MFTIGINVSVEGTVRADDVTIAGTFSGFLIGRKIYVSPTANVSGTLAADVVIVDGFATADIFAERLTLSDTCTVRGRIYHADLTVAKLAFFEGRSRRHANPRALFEQMALEQRAN